MPRFRATPALAILIATATAAATTLAPARTQQSAAPVVIAGHQARFDDAGQLLPWIDWSTALDREMNFYQTASVDHGYPIFVTTTFLDGAWHPTDRTDTIPATQNGMGILSYLAYYESQQQGPRDRYLQVACAMGDYLVDVAVTPNSGKYPRFPRSTGRRGQFPLAPDSGSQSDHPYEIEPDKGGIAGYALFELAGATRGNASTAARSTKYFNAALHIAITLTIEQRPGDATHSPWPFRADFRTGESRGDVSSNMVYILRLYDALIAGGHAEFTKPRTALWTWINTQQIPSAAATSENHGALFAQFFEDHDNPSNRNAWAPLNLARYLIDQRTALDPDWRADAKTLIDFVRANFTHKEFGVTVCYEQDEDHDPWNGINSTYGAVLALYAKATNDAALANDAQQALNFSEYSIDEKGRPRDLFKNPVGGWQEDAHTDVIHNFLDALAAYPAWRN